MLSVNIKTTNYCFWDVINVWLVLSLHSPTPGHVNNDLLFAVSIINRSQQPNLRWFHSRLFLWNTENSLNSVTYFCVGPQGFRIIWLPRWKQVDINLAFLKIYTTLLCLNFGVLDDRHNDYCVVAQHPLSLSKLAHILTCRKGRVYCRSSLLILDLFTWLLKEAATAAATSQNCLLFWVWQRNSGFFSHLRVSVFDVSVVQSLMLPSMRYSGPRLVLWWPCWHHRLGRHINSNSCRCPWIRPDIYCRQ